MNDLELALAASLFAEGFRVGAGPRTLRMSERDWQLHRDREPHFAAGLKAGREAAKAAREAYKRALVLLLVEDSSQGR